MAGRVSVRERGRQPIADNNWPESLKAVVRALALGVLLASSVSAQYLEATIMLPDTLGPLNGPYCLTCTDDSAFPRLYVGGAGGFYPGRPPEDSGGVIVANALTCKRLARIPTGPVKTLCYVPTHNKLYVASLTADSVRVVDCASNEVISAIHVSGRVPVMQYDRRYDRLFCGGDQVSVVDCAADTVVHTIPVAASVCALDSIHNRLYVGASGSLSVIDCASDSVVATVPRVRSASALSFNRTAQKVYATTQDSLYAIRTADNSVAAVLAFTGLAPLLSCNAQRNRIYCHNDGHWSSIDCTADTVVFSGSCSAPSFMACDVARNRLYIVVQYTMWVIDASNGQGLVSYVLDSWPYGACWCPGIDRFFSLPCYSSRTLFQSCLTMSVDCGADSIFSVIPLTLRADIISIDSVYNRLYLMYHTSLVGAVGTVDCVRNIVTSFTYAGEEPGPMCYNPNNDHLYWISSNYRGVPLAFVVFDCSTGTVVKRFPLSGWVEKLQINIGLNKLYIESFESAAVAILVVDGARDSVVKRIVVPSGSQVLRLVPEDNVLWSLCVHHVVAIDCVSDSMIANVADTLRSIDDAICCPEDRKIYTSDGQVIDMDDPRYVDSIPFHAGRFCYVPGLHKLFGCGNRLGPPPPPGDCIVRVLDTRTDSVTTAFFGPRMVSGMCLGPTGDYIYCAVYADTMMFVIDVRGDSVLSMFPVPIAAAARDPLAVNTLTHRVYEAEYDYLMPVGRIPVVHDSIRADIGESPKPQTVGYMPRATVVHGMLFVSNGGSSMSCLLDAIGRRVMQLRPGPNDVSRLAPGIFFVRAVGPEPSEAICSKVVIAR